MRNGGIFYPSFLPSGRPPQAMLKGFLTFSLSALFFLFLAFIPATESDGGSPGDAELMKGLEFFYQGEPDQACSAFEEARRLNPDLAPAGVLTAILFSQKGDLAATHRYLNRAVAESPDDPEAWFRLARLAADENRVPELELLLAKGDELLKRFKAAHPSKDDVRIRYLTGEAISLAARLAQEKGDWAGAESLMRDYLSFDPASDEGHISLGYLLLEQKKIDEAVAMFDKARALNPERFSGWLTAASLMNEKGWREEAERLVDDHRTEDDLTCADLSRTGHLLFQWDRIDDARQIADRLPAESAERHKLTGLLDYNDGDYSEAETEYRAAFRTNPNDHEAANGLILALAEQNNKSKLMEAREKADANRKKRPNSDEAAGTLAWTEFLLGRIERSEDLLLPILDRSGLTPTNAYYLARVAALRRDYDFARQLLDNALEASDHFSKRGDAEELRDLLLKEAKGDAETE